MNKASVFRIDDRTSGISFDDQRGHELTFGLEIGGGNLQVWEQKKIGKNVMATSATLPLDYLKKQVKIIRKKREPTILLIKTPFGDYFSLFPDDLAKLGQFLGL